jgi:hypothetical protein
MPRVTNAQAAARRERVAEFWVRGVSVAGIAKAVGCDWETARRDISLLGRRAVAETDVPGELHRLLLAGRAVEASAWARQELGLALAAQKAQLAVLTTLQGLDVERRLAELEARLQATEAPALTRAPVWRN